jgi:4-amino-4-deoxy-L-arabinose transferase-like glycosyltransferase
LTRSNALLIGMIVVILALAFVLCIPVNPRLASISLDSGLYAYAARVMHSGGVLYRDVWDHKPPAVFFTNLIALSLFGDNPWGIWWFGVFWNVVIGIAFFAIAQQFTNRSSAFAGTIFTLITLHHPLFYNLGNQNELYAFLPQAANFWAALNFFKSQDRKWILVVGLCASIAFLFKATYIGTGMALMLIVLAQDARAKQWKLAFRNSLAFLISFLAPIAITAIYFAAQGLLDELWQASILFNFTYNQEGFSYEAFADKLVTLVTWPLVLALLLAIAGFIFFWRKDRRETLAPIFLAVPIEVVLLFLSSRAFGHYYLTLLPALGLAATYGIFKLMQGASKTKIVIAILLLSSYTLVNLPSPKELTSLQEPLHGDYLLTDVERYILDRTTESDYVLTWSDYIGINYSTNRPFPSKYVFVSQLFDFPPDLMDARFDEFLAELDRRPPLLILAEQSPSLDMPSLAERYEDLQCRNCTKQQLQNLIKVKNYLRDHYELVDQVDGWLIFRRVAE